MGIALMALGACGGSPKPSAASVVKAQSDLAVPAPEGISVKVTGTSAVVRWSAPKGLTVPLKGYEFYLDQTPAVSVGPQVTSYQLTGLASESHYAQVVALTATGESDPIAASFEVAYAAAAPGPTGTARPQETTPTQTPVAATQAPVATQAPPEQTPELSVSAACETAISDLQTVDTDAAGVIRGDNNEIATGHSFGALIIDLQNVSQNVSDSRLASLVTTATADVIGLRNLYVAGGNAVAESNLDPDAQAVQEYCSTQTDPLGGNA
ncbi:MAG TPA: hypothetical protein VHZ96_11530 [Frankiaceae bacterium]|nr:hypothetical protein [Frankiaceae bacterium]